MSVCVFRSRPAIRTNSNTSLSSCREPGPSLCHSVSGVLPRGRGSLWEGCRRLASVRLSGNSRRQTPTLPSPSSRPSADGLWPGRAPLPRAFAGVRSGGPGGSVLRVAFPLGGGDRARPPSQGVLGLPAPLWSPLASPESEAHTRTHQCRGKRGPALCHAEGLAPFWGAVPWGTAQDCRPTSPRTEPDIPPWVASSLTHPALIFLRGGGVSSALATGEGDKVTPGGDPAPGCPGAPPPDRSPPGLL